MPGEVDAEVKAEIVCKGEIVRSVLPAEGGVRAALAARILEYQFIRGQKRCAA